MKINDPKKLRLSIGQEFCLKTRQEYILKALTAENLLRGGPLHLSRDQYYSNVLSRCFETNKGSRYIESCKYIVKQMFMRPKNRIEN